jgi:hypothetical protein
VIGAGEWENAWSLITPEGTLDFNTTDGSTDITRGQRFQLNPAKCNAILPVRATEDDVPQGDGAIPHRRWRSGYGIHLAIEPLQNYDDETGDGEPACDEALVDMLDLLGLHLNAMIRTGLVSGFPNARLIYPPTGKDDRMFDRCQLAAGGIVVNQDGALGGTQVEVDLSSPYPYYLEAAETQTMIAETSTETITNVGQTEGFPVVELFGDGTYAEVINHSIVDLDGNPLKLVYFSALPGASPLPGGSEWIEFNFFTGSAFLNGNQANRLAGVDWRYTELFPLVPGDNVIEAIGAMALVRSNGYFA